MKRFYCNGKKGYCDRGNDDTIDCKDCEFANGTGGEVVNVSDTVYEKIEGSNEIIKALEAILNREYREDTVPTAVATIEFFKCVYNFIDRQKAEIESLKIANEKMYQACKEQEAEQERECPTCYGTGKLHTSNWLTKGIAKEQLAKEREKAQQEVLDFFRAEAIKEFAKRLKIQYSGYKVCGSILINAEIDDLVKEMTEEKKCQQE